jgi:hypothetical protein
MKKKPNQLPEPTPLCDMTNLKQSPAYRSPWLFVLLGLFSLFMSFLIVPAFSYGRGAVSYAALPGTLTGTGTALVCSWALIRCPRRPILPKLVTFLLLIPGLVIGFFCLSSYLMFGLNNEFWPNI